MQLQQQQGVQGMQGFQGQQVLEQQGTQGMQGQQGQLSGGGGENGDGWMPLGGAGHVAVASGAGGGVASRRHHGRCQRNPAHSRATGAQGPQRWILSANGATGHS